MKTRTEVLYTEVGFTRKKNGGKLDKMPPMDIKHKLCNLVLITYISSSMDYFYYCKNGTYLDMNEKHVYNVHKTDN